MSKWALPPEGLRRQDTFERWHLPQLGLQPYPELRDDSHLDEAVARAIEMLGYLREAPSCGRPAFSREAADWVLRCVMLAYEPAESRDYYFIKAMQWWDAENAKKTT